METVIIMSATILAALLALHSARGRVPAGHVGVATRAGRAIRLVAAGERIPMSAVGAAVHMVRVSPATLEIPGLVVPTRDGARVDLALSVRWRVRDPEVAAKVRPSDLVWEAVERAVQKAVGALPLRDLLEAGPEAAARIRDQAAAILHEGDEGTDTDSPCEVLDVAVTHVAVDAGTELMRLLR